MKKSILQFCHLVLFVLLFMPVLTFAQTDKVHFVLGLDTTITIDPTVLRLRQPNGNTQIGDSIVTSHTGAQNTILGSNSFRQNISGSNNVGIGAFALNMNSTGSLNTGIGWHALLKNTTGFRNVAIGSAALILNIDGFENIAIGSGSLSSNTSGSKNTGIGYLALQENTTGVENVAIGKNAMKRNIDGNYNTALGNFSLRDNTSGSQNVALGFKAMINNIAGNNNVAVGQAAMEENTDGLNNIAIGTRALYLNTMASNNIAVGFESLRNNNTGAFNIALGNNAAKDNTSGSNNIAFGFDALSKNTDGVNNTIIGLNALKVANDNVNFNVAVGSEVMNFTQEGAFNTAIGHNAGGRDTTSLRNTYVGYAAGSGDVEEDDRNKADNVMLGFFAGFNSAGSSNVFLGQSSGLGTSGSNKLFIENSAADSADALIYGEFDNDLIRLNGKVVLRDGYTDIDGDTKILLEENSDEDKIRFYIDNSEALRVEKNTEESINFHVAHNEANLFIGYQAGQSNGQDSIAANDGGFNTAFGFLSLQDNTSGQTNTAVGASTLTNNIGGDGNTSMGWGSMLSNLSGSYNTANGISTLKANTTGWYNSALGQNALGENNSGNFNVGIGSRSGLFNTSGSNSVYIGTNAGAGGTTTSDMHSKSNNVMIGYNSGQQAQGSNNVFLGYESGKNETGNNKLIIENSDADETSALIYGEFDNDYLRINGQVDIDGKYTLPTNMGTNGHVLHTNGAGSAYWAVDNNGLWGVNGDHAIYEDGRVGVQTASPSDALHVVGNGVEDLFRVQLGSSTKMRVYNNGSISLGSNNAGIGTGDVYVANDFGIGVVPTYKFHVSKFDSNNSIAMVKNTSTNGVAGGMSIELGPNTNPGTSNRFIRFQDGNGTLIGSVTGNGSGGVQYNTTSDRRLKMNIENCENGLELINKINPKVYERISNPGEKEIGFIAQELYEVFPQVVAGTPDSDIETPMMVDYGQMTPLLVAALKEQQLQIEKLEAQLSIKNSDLEELKSQIMEIRSMLGK